ncbi:MAG: HEPN domain-containing protein [Candidatus Sumerlaeota bacterium]|nr:HEPN domain-containing protein [Candidatus Sumerlaeota bacterium]
MDEAKKELVQSWLTKAAHDLAAAKSLAADEEPLLDVAIYHCQQAAEKSVKGLLVAGDICFGKTHDVKALIAQALPIAPELTPFLLTAGDLTNYATEFRYPGAKMAPEREEFMRALMDSEAIVSLVLKLIDKA